MILLTGLGMDSKLKEIEMRKFETKDALAEWIETMHLQNTNGRETELEMFRLGIQATIEELTEFNLFSIPVVVGQRELFCDCDKPTLGNNVWTCGCGKPFKKKDK